MTQYRERLKHDLLQALISAVTVTWPQDYMPVLNLKSIEDTALWQRLRDGFARTPSEPLAIRLAANLAEICREAGDWMKAVPINMPQYTLHDQVHLLRVTELMSMVLGRVAEKLNPIELTLLILSANFHDHGMVLSGEDIEKLEADKKYQLFRDNWIVDHPNLKEVQAQLARQDLNNQEKARFRLQEQDLLRGMLTEYIRATHGDRSKDFVKSHYGSDQRWAPTGTNLADLVGRLCRSHSYPASSMTAANGFHDDREVGTFQVNLRYLGLILRLADILDLDRDRTPDLLYKAIHFTNQISIIEWEKHRGVEGWTISPSHIRFTMEFEHPAYERTARRFMDWIDEELAASHAIVRSFPALIGERYKLELPERVDRSRIGPKDGYYQYHELEFSLSRDEIVKLLMTDKLYGDPSLCIRELIQNSMDALRHRRALHGRDGQTWSGGIVKLEHTVDADGHEVVRCTDTGVGMDEGIITRFLTRAGRSFYRSPEFEQERLSFKSAGVDFDPCARFGIGFMSCFMLGDRIVIHTRRDRGPRGGYGDPLIVEINGLGGLLVIRKGAGDQPVGTTVEITGPRKPGFLDAGSDRVKLVHVVFGYALATEFPIEARCNIKEIKASLNVPTEIASRPTIIERAGITSARTFVQSFAEVDPLLRGEVRCSVLLDENQRPALSNKEARWIPTIQHSGPVLRRSDGNAGEESEPDWNRGTICVDGMLVSGSPGRIPGSQVERYLGVRYAVINLANPFLVDIRGELKPRLTPARVPPERGSRLSPSWRRIQKLMWRAEGKLWENVARELTSGLSNESFWELTELQGPGLHLMSASAIWSFISVPLVDQLGSVIWAKISQLGTLSCQGTQNDWHLLDTGGRRITSHDGVHRWMSPGSGGNPQREVETLVVLMSTLVLEGGEPRLMLLPPTEPLRHPCDFLLQDFFGFRTYPIPYGMELTHIFSAEVPFETVNRRHPLFQLVVDMEYAETSSEIQAFARGCVDWLSNSTTVAAIVSESNRRVSRGLRWLGHQYLAVDWSSVHEELRPPYTIWSAKHGLIKVEAKHFESWAIDTPEEEDDD